MALSFEESTSDLLPPSLRRVYLKISPQRFDLASPARFCSQVNAMRRRGRKVREDDREWRRREIVPGVSSLTTCDELREARSEIKRVPENSRGSARSNYLREARGVRTDCGVDIFSPSFLYFSIGPAFAVSFSLSRLPCDADGQPKRWKGTSKGNYFGLLFCARFWRTISRGRSETRGQRDVELAELNTAHKLRHEGPSWSETNGGQEFNFISQWIS